MTNHRKTDFLLPEDDRTQAMLEHMTRVQMREQIMAQVTTDETARFADMVVGHMNARGAGVLEMPRLSLMMGVCHEALAVAMPRVELNNRHPAHPTLQ
jgi:hypothetical protein